MFYVFYIDKCIAYCYTVFMKQQINFRASAHTAEQLGSLIQKTGMNQTEVIAVAIDRMFREETMNTKHFQQIAAKMHGELCDCDDKNCTLEDEIIDWLTSGDAQNLTPADVPDLLAEWREYAGQEE